MIMFFVYLFCALIVACSARNIALKKGRDWQAWFWLCFIFPFAFLLLVTLDVSEEKKVYDELQKKREFAREYRKCPHCAEYIKQEAKVCRYCGRDVPPREIDLETYWNGHD